MPILFVPLAILGMTACSPQNALHTRLPFAKCDRRQVLAQPALVAAVLSAGLSAPAHAAVAPKDITTVKLLTVKAKKLRASVRTSAGNRRSLPLDPTPGVNNYASTTGAVLRAKKEVLQPLLAAMKVAAASSTDLPDEITKPLKLQPLLMQGHLLELDQALKEYKFEAYVSKYVPGRTVSERGAHRMPVLEKLARTV